MSTNCTLSTLFAVPTPNTHGRCGRESLYPTSSIQESMQRLDLSNQLTITSLSPIFEGTYSDIYKGNYHEGLEASSCFCGSSASHVQVAIKSIRAVKDTEGMQMKIQHLVTTLCPLSHPNVLPCYGYAKTKGFGDYGAIISAVSA
jgi:hypothetical protein